MALLPGVPDMGPKPVSPTIPGGANTTVGKPGGIAQVANSVGKPGNTQHLGSVVGRTGKGMTSVGGGDPLAHGFNHYGKKPPASLGGQQITGGVDPTAHPGSKQIRGGLTGGVHRVRSGGLGPERIGMPGPSDTNYSNTSEDTE